MDKITKKKKKLENKILRGRIKGDKRLNNRKQKVKIKNRNNKWIEWAKKTNKKKKKEERLLQWGIKKRREKEMSK